MTYSYRLQDLLELLQTKAATAGTVAANHRRVDRGLLSVGLKIHCLDQGWQFDKLIEGLGGALKILEVNHYKDARASLCLVLPPVGSATCAIELHRRHRAIHRLANFRQPANPASAMFAGAPQCAGVRLAWNRLLSRLGYSSSLHPGGPPNYICVAFRSPAWSSACSL